MRQLQQLTPQIVARGAHLFDAEAGTLPPAGRGGFGAAAARSAYVHYWLGEDADVSLEIQDGNGGSVNVLEADGSAGLHMIEWTLERMGDGPGGRGGGFFRRRDYVQPGTYTAVLTVDGQRHVVPVVVGRS